MCAHSCPTLRNPMDCSPPGPSVPGILQARILEWVVIFSSRGSSQLRDWTHISCIGRQILYHEPPGKLSSNTMTYKSLIIKTLSLGSKRLYAFLTWLMALRSHNKYAGLMVSSFPLMVIFFFVCLFSSWKSLGLFNFRSATLASEYNCNYKIIGELHVGKLNNKDTFKFPVNPWS